MDENCSQVPSNSETNVERSPSKRRLELSDEVGKLSPNDRADSPDSNCAICLGKLQNKSFTDGCLHQFCFTCLLEWSKVKAECPLCKQGFESIIHNVRSIEDYDQYHLRQHEPRLSIQELSFPFLDSTPLPRFRYRTTMVPNHQPFYGYLQRLEHMMSHGEIIPSEFFIPQHHRRPSWRHSNHISAHGSSTSSLGGRRSGRSADIALPGTSGFRRNIYNNRLWVRRLPDLTGRFRECSAEFFLNNQAQIHRLVPWLNRELNVLLTSSDQVQNVLTIILDLLPRYNIRSQEFRTALQPLIGARTEHFIHEFYAFGTSPYDMIGYDRVCLYGPRFNYSDENDATDSSSDSDVQIVEEVVGGRYEAASTAGPSSEIPSYDITHHSSPVAGPSRPSETCIAVSSDSNSSDCEIVGTVKPRHLRTPEIITLDESDEDVPSVNCPPVCLKTEKGLTEESEAEQKPVVNFNLIPKSDFDRHQSSHSHSDRTEKRTCSNPTENLRRHLSRNERSIDDNSNEWYKNFYLKHPLSRQMYYDSSISSTNGFSSGEEWGAKRAVRKHKRDKHRRSNASDKKSRDKEKKKKVKKEKKSKPIKHWKKKLCKKLESSSSSNEIFENRSSSRKRKTVSSSSESDDNCYVKRYSSESNRDCGRNMSRLKSVVYDKRNINSNGAGHSVLNSSVMPYVKEIDKGPSTSNDMTNGICVSVPGTSTSNTRPHLRTLLQQQHRLRSSSTSSSSSSSASSEHSSLRKESFRKMKPKRNHV